MFNSLHWYIAYKQNKNYLLSCTHPHADYQGAPWKNHRDGSFDLRDYIWSKSRPAFVWDTGQLE